MEHSWSTCLGLWAISCHYHDKWPTPLVSCSIQLHSSSSVTREKSYWDPTGITHESHDPTLHTMRLYSTTNVWEKYTLYSTSIGVDDALLHLSKLWCFWRNSNIFSSRLKSKGGSPIKMVSIFNIQKPKVIGSLMILWFISLRKDDAIP